MFVRNFRGIHTDHVSLIECLCVCASTAAFPFSSEELCCGPTLRGANSSYSWIGTSHTTQRTMLGTHISLVPNHLLVTCMNTHTHTHTHILFHTCSVQTQESVAYYHTQMSIVYISPWIAWSLFGVRLVLFIAQLGSVGDGMWCDKGFIGASL